MKLTVDESIKRIPFYPKAALYGSEEGWTRLASNENPFPPSSKAVNSILESVLSITRYPESEFELKALLAARYGLEPENIVIGNGSNELIETAFKGMRHPTRKRVLVHEPSFAFYSIAAQIYGYEARQISFPGLTVDLDVILGKIDETIRIVFLNNPNNPTGTIFEDGAFKSFLDRLPPEVLVVVDEAYAEFATSKKFPKSMAYVRQYPVLVLRTFSKAYGLAGLRVGYGVADALIASFVERTKQPFSVNMMALIAAKAALSDEKYVANVLESNIRGRDFFYGLFAELGLSFIQTEANFVLVHVGPDAENLTKKLFEKKILVRWMGAYELPEYIRVTIGTMEENKIFASGLRGLLK
ncbi:MAG TPA: histidinol-phosphate transaminase [Syntrophorhabdales bacterium]|nr:histidinol-phosphate transaminase [Syntrophorhabdales bacterium]